MTYKNKNKRHDYQIFLQSGRFEFESGRFEFEIGRLKFEYGKNNKMLLKRKYMPT